MQVESKRLEMVKIDMNLKRPRKRVDARVTVGFDPVTYDLLEEAASSRCAPLAQIVREAVAAYLANQTSNTHTLPSRSE